MGKNKNISESVFKDTELTRYGFIAHMEDYMRQLLQNAKTAQPDEYLKERGLDGPKALSLLLKRTDPEDPESAVLMRTERIRPDENGKDRFFIKYKLPRKDYNKKMRNLYIMTFENYIADGSMLNEDGGATSCGSCLGGGQLFSDGSSDDGNDGGYYTTPITKKPLRRKIYVTEEQMAYVKKSLNESSPCVMDTAAGNFGFDAPMGDGKNNKGNKFFDAANDHKNMMEKSWEEGK